MTGKDLDDLAMSFCDSTAQVAGCAMLSLSAEDIHRALVAYCEIHFHYRDDAIALALRVGRILGTAEEGPHA